MKVILTQDIPGVGYKNTTLVVEPGYGQGFLIPRGLAVTANAVNSKNAAENLRQSEHRLLQRRQEAQKQRQELSKVVLQIPIKVDDKGHPFGRITTKHIADALAEQGINLHHKMISLPRRQMKSLGTHEALLYLHKEVQCKLAFTVVPEITTPVDTSDDMAKAGQEQQEDTNSSTS